MVKLKVNKRRLDSKKEKKKESCTHVLSGHQDSMTPMKYRWTHKCLWVNRANGATVSLITSYPRGWGFNPSSALNLLNEVQKIAFWCRRLIKSAVTRTKMFLGLVQRTEQLMWTKIIKLRGAQWPSGLTLQSIENINKSHKDPRFAPQPGQSLKNGEALFLNLMSSGHSFND